MRMYDLEVRLSNEKDVVFLEQDGEPGEVATIALTIDQLSIVRDWLYQCEKEARTETQR